MWFCLQTSGSGTAWGRLQPSPSTKKVGQVLRPAERINSQFYDFVFTRWSSGTWSILVASLSFKFWCPPSFFSWPARFLVTLRWSARRSSGHSCISWGEFKNVVDRQVDDPPVGGHLNDSGVPKYIMIMHEYIHLWGNTEMNWLIQWANCTCSLPPNPMSGTFPEDPPPDGKG